VSDISQLGCIEGVCPVARLIRPQALMLLCEYVLNSTRAPPSEAFLYATLLQLYLAPSLADEGGGGGEDSDAEGAPNGASTSQTVRRCGAQVSAHTV
jgi:hypothetical protein